MPQNNQTDGRKWRECDRCGFDWPEEELVYNKQTWVCPRCYLEDNSKPERVDQC